MSSKTKSNIPRIAFISSCVDLGTSSITRILERTIQPQATHYLSMGVKKLSLVDLLRVLRFFVGDARHCEILVAAFNAPVLLTGLFGWIAGRRTRVAILEWNELTARSSQKIPFFRLYGPIYKQAFSGFHRRFSPSPCFIDFYRREGITFLPLHLPLPEVDSEVIEPCASQTKTIRVLFVGGDIKRKGGDELLSAWAASPPSAATLSFVSPNAPTMRIPGVTFLRDIAAGTPQHARLFHEHDVLVLPTYADSFGYVILEALARGLCVVTTEQAGAAYVAQFFGGLVCKNTEQAITALFELLNHPDDVANRKMTAINHRDPYQQMVDASFCSLLNTEARRTLRELF